MQRQHMEIKPRSGNWSVRGGKCSRCIHDHQHSREVFRNCFMEECSQLTPTLSYSFSRHRLIDFFLLQFYEIVSHRIFLNRSLVGHVFLFYPE
jgi:hypothetical protein